MGLAVDLAIDPADAEPSDLAAIQATLLITIQGLTPRYPFIPHRYRYRRCSFRIAIENDGKRRSRYRRRFRSRMARRNRFSTAGCESEFESLEFQNDRFL